jgi:hypothetical protein
MVFELGSERVLSLSHSDGGEPSELDRVIVNLLDWHASK